MRGVDRPDIAIISGVMQVSSTHNLRYLATLCSLGLRTEVVMPGRLHASANLPAVSHVRLPSPRTSFWYGAGFLNLLNAILSRGGNFIRLCWYLARRRPRAIIAIEPDSWLASVVIGRLGGAKILVDIQEVYEDRSLAFPRPFQGVARRALRWLMRMLSRRTDQIIHVSPERARFHNYLRQEGYRVITPYPDLQTFDEAGFADREYREIGYVVIHAGALRATYAGDELLQGLEVVARTAPSVRLVVLGGIAGTLQRMDLVEKLRLSGNLELHPQVSFERVTAFLKDADIGINLVLPIDNLHRLAQPRKLYEYYGAGLPVIVADVPTLRNLVGGAETGLVVDPYDPASIAGAITKLIPDRKLRQEQGRRARALFEQQYNWDRESDKLRSVIQAVAMRQQ